METPASRKSRSNDGGAAYDPSLDPLRQALAALGDERRFLLVTLLGARPRSVGELVQATGMAQPLVSHHLAVLSAAGVAEAERSGRSRIYRIGAPEDPSVRAVLRLILRPPDGGGVTAPERDAEVETAGQEAEDRDGARGDARRRRDDLEEYLL